MHISLELPVIDVPYTDFGKFSQSIDIYIA